MRLRHIVAICLFVSCGQKHPEQALLDRVREATEPNPNAGVTDEPHLDRVERVKAEGFQQLPIFFVAARTPKIERFPCGRCHNNSLAMLVNRTAKEGKKAHWSIPLDHAPQQTMTCKTCHGEGTMEELMTLNGTSVNMNHSYQVCGQCHSKQLQDWAGGAHGKRLGGWAPPRVVLSCAGCHNPHRPKLDSRLPATRENPGEGKR